MSFFADHYWQITFAVLVPGILYASWVDYAERRVPNWLNALLAAIGLAVQSCAFGWYVHGVGGVGWGLLGLAVGFGVLVIPWLMHGMGAGDVKLMAATVADAAVFRGGSGYRRSGGGDHDLHDGPRAARLHEHPDDHDEDAAI